MWFLPDLDRDGDSGIASFANSNGLNRIRYLQMQTEKHLQLVQDICTMADADVLALEDPRCPARKKIQLSKEMALSFFLSFIAGMRTMYDTGEHSCSTLTLRLCFTLKLSPEGVARVGNHFVTQIL